MRRTYLGGLWVPVFSFVGSEAAVGTRFRLLKRERCECWIVNIGRITYAGVIVESGEGRVEK